MERCTFPNGVEVTGGGSLWLVVMMLAGMMGVEDLGPRPSGPFSERGLNSSDAKSPTTA
jgi:hypothetical protein